MPLSDTQIRKAKSTEKTQRLFDAGGLYLEISPKGGKWWRIKYRFGGKPIAETNAPQLLEVIRRIEQRGTLETAHRALGNCGQVFPVYIVTKRRPPPDTPPCLDEMVRMVAAFGGFLNRKHDGFPGPRTAWIGLQRTRDFVLAREAILESLSGRVV